MKDHPKHFWGLTISMFAILFLCEVIMAYIEPTFGPFIKEFYIILFYFYVFPVCFLRLIPGKQDWTWIIPTLMLILNLPLIGTCEMGVSFLESFSIASPIGVLVLWLRKSYPDSYLSMQLTLILLTIGTFLYLILYQYVFERVMVRLHLLHEVRSRKSTLIAIGILCIIGMGPACRWSVRTTRLAIDRAEIPAIVQSEPVEDCILHLYSGFSTCDCSYEWDGRAYSSQVKIPEVELESSDRPHPITTGDTITIYISPSHPNTVAYKWFDQEIRF